MSTSGAVPGSCPVCENLPVVALPMLGHGVVVERLVPTDASALSVSHSDPENALYQGWQSPLSESQALSFIATFHAVEPLDFGGGMQLAIREAPGGPLAGDLYLSRAAASPSAVEVGITLAPGFQGRGLAIATITAVADAVLGTVVGGETVRRLVAVLDVDNLRSRALFERLGFRLEVHQVATGRRRDGTLAAELVFAVTDREWPREGQDE